MVSGLAWFYMVLKYNTSDYSTYLMNFQVGRGQRVGLLMEGGARVGTFRGTKPFKGEGVVIHLAALSLISEEGPLPYKGFNTTCRHVTSCLQTTSTST